MLQYIEPLLINVRLAGEIKRLRKENSPDAAVLVDLLVQEKEHRLSREETEWINRIERERRVLLADRSRVTITDFGAGSKVQKDSGPVVAQGREVTRIVGQVCRAASKSKFWALFLFKLMRILQPKYSLELGTCLGISTAYQAAALALNQAGAVTTIEGAMAYAAIAQAMFTRLGLTNVVSKVGRFQDVLPAVLSPYNAWLDYIFIDGHHNGDATIRYFNQIAPHARNNALFVFDDIFWPDMRKAWDVIKRCDQVAGYADLYTVGLCMVQTGQSHGKERS